MDGIIIINKEKNYTSHDVVAKVKRILNVKKVGHTGTLDPNATGVLPILLNKGTQLSKYLINHDKIYDVTLKLGEKTDTADSEGNIIESEEVKEEAIEEKIVNEAINSFIGKQKQKPPMYSAIKINGKKLYEYARNGVEIEIPTRDIEIYNIELEKIDKKNKIITFKVECSKGTYIRSLCEDIANKLHTIGYMKELNRLKVGEFSIENAITIKELEKLVEENKIESNLISFEKIFEKNEKLILKNKDMQLFLNGAFSKNSRKYNLKDGIYKIYNDNNKFIGTGICKNSELKRDIIL